MTTFNLYANASLTTPAATPLAFTQDADGVMTPHNRQFFLGSPDAGLKFQAVSNPGVDQCQLQIVDGATGSGQPATAIKLALTEAGLASATAGAALDLGATILSGAANAISVWVQFDDSTAVVATSNDVSLQTNPLIASAV